MAIRLRTINGEMIALCAAKSVPKEGDIYFDDNAHYALMIKFGRDFAESDGVEYRHPAYEYHHLIDAEEDNNSNRDLWNIDRLRELDEIELEKITKYVVYKNT